jgi:hypothetical protein
VARGPAAGGGVVRQREPAVATISRQWAGTEGQGTGGRGGCHELLKEEAGRRTSLKEDIGKKKDAIALPDHGIGGPY